MRNRSDTWKQLTIRGKFELDAQIVISDTEYKTISAPRISRSLMSSPLQVGNCNSATLSVSIMTDDEIPAAGEVIVQARVGSRAKDYLKSEYKDFGTFYIDQRDTSYAGLVTLTCYDAMLKTNSPYLSDTDTELSWPKTMVAVVNEIAARIGVTLDTRTVLKTGDDYKVAYPKGLTMTQVLGYIGACNGGNWIITEENRLRLVPLVTIPDETYYIIDYDYRYLKTAEGDYLAWADMPEGTTPKDDFLNIPVVLGGITNGAPMTVRAVSGTGNDSTVYTAGDTEAGITLDIGSNPYVTQGIIDALYADYDGLIYEPYSAARAIYDPAVELGDKIKIGEYVHSVLYNTDMTFDLAFTSDLSAPNSAELTSEYPYLSAVEKMQRSTETFAQQVTESTGALTEEVNTAKSLTQQIAESLESEIKRAGNAEKALNTNLSTEIKRATDAENALSGRVKALEDATPGSSEMESLKTTVATHTQDIATLRSDLATLTTRVSSLETTVSGQGSRIAAVEEKNTAQDTSIGTLQNADAAQSELIAQIQGQITSILSRLDALES